MTDQINFTLLSGSFNGYFLYEWQVSNSHADVLDNGWKGLLVQQKKGTPPEQISFEEAWKNYPGDPADSLNGSCYIFSRKMPKEHQNFLDIIVNLIDNLNKIQSEFSYRYFLWIYNPDGETPDSLLAQSLPFTSKKNAMTGEVVHQKSNSFRNNAVSFGNIYLAIPQGISINADPVSSAFGFINFNDTIKLWNSNGAVSFGKVGSQVKISINENPGSLLFDAIFNTLSVDGNDFIKMEAGIRYFIKLKSGRASSQLYPVWRTQVEWMSGVNIQYPIQATLNPLRPEDHDQTHFLMINHKEKGKTLEAFESCFVTPNGHPVLLTPLANSTRLVLMGGLLNSDSQVRDMTGLFYIAPDGPMVLSIIEASADETLLMCGLNGTESISFLPQTETQKGLVLNFKSDMPAYAPDYPFQQASPVGPPIDASAMPLTDTLKTSWLTLTQQTSDGESRYTALPKGFSLYGCDKVIHAGYKDFLGPSAPTNKFSLSGEYYFPMVPYFGFTVGDWCNNQLESFEKEVLSPCRRVIIAKNNSALQAPKNLMPTEGDSPISITTPSGQLVTQGQGGDWQKILLGQLNHPVESQIYFQAPKTQLTQAFQTSDLMLVIANPEYLGVLSNGPGAGKTSCLFNNTLNLEEWVLAAQVGDNYSYGDYSNVVIVKGVKGKLYDPNLPVSETLVATPSRWTQKKDFAAPNGKMDELVPLTQWLQDYFKDAAEKGADKTNPDAVYFQKFNQIAQDENWTGVLVLRAKIADMPEQMKGIAAGVKDPSAFYAHHFAIELSQTQIGPNGPEINDSSSVYGLIYYNDSAYDSSKPKVPVAPDPGTVYDFRLLSLKVLFENSAVKHFQSYAQVTLNELFGSKVSKMGEGGNLYNSIVLSGSFQENAGQPVYGLSTVQDYIFLFDNSALNKIEIVSARMNTVSATLEKTDILFAMTGYLDFKILQKGEGSDALNIDLFSFGSTDGTTVREGLYFSNLSLEMNYPTQTPQQKIFTFSTKNISFDMESSTIRQNSLYRSFALELEGLNAGDRDNTPVQQGYINVITDLRLSGVDSGIWNGLRFRLNLGTPGELAGKVGLNADLLLAWSALGGKDNDYQMNVGLSLPGATGGANLISLQNVLKLSFGPIRLLYVKENETSQDRRFMMLLTDIAIKFLGLMKIPPNGASMFYLFGNPQSDGKSSGLGWYARYKQDKGKTKAMFAEKKGDKNVL